MQIYIDTVWGQPQPQALQLDQEAPDRPLKARNSDFHHKNPHIDCYYLCQQYEDHFETAGVKVHKCVSFAASFFCKRINFCWQQYKLCVKRKRVNLITWEEFKAFLRKSFGDSNLFVDNIWSKIKRDLQYQYEEVQDWASHLEHFQSIFIKFDAKCASLEDLLVWYFYEGFRPLIKLWTDKKGRELDS